ncbi:MAG TPA: NUDIX domain-containing protein [Candidatus Binataceae bacterium]|nr:NUDIX domain-containing protein [Candidatus Binataceae bacterium]
MSDRTMVTFSSGGAGFTYRVGAIIIRDDHVLLMRNLAEDYWFVPGGRVEIGEPAEKALAREIAEELNVTASVERLIWINENFFRAGQTYQHELALYFSVAIPAEVHSDLSMTFYADEADGSRFEVAWHRTKTLKDIYLVPSFLSEALTNIPGSVRHVIHVDDSARDWIS